MPDRIHPTAVGREDSGLAALLETLLPQALADADPAGSDADDWTGSEYVMRMAAALAPGLRAAADNKAPDAKDFPDHTHRWQERSQQTLDAEYNETGSLLGRWYCPGCYTDTMVEPDRRVCGDGLVGFGCGLPIASEPESYRCTECSVAFHRDCANEHFAAATETTDHE